MVTLARQILVENVLMLWHGRRHDTHSISIKLGVSEREVAEIIEQSEGRKP